jgi:NADH dehydrogenase
MKKVLILGGGHGGVFAATELLKRRRSPDEYEVTMVNHDNVEVWHGMMPQIVSGVVEPQHTVSSLREILPGIVLYSCPVESIDLPNRKVICDPGGEGAKIVLDYDYLLIAIGSVTDLSRFPGLAEHGFQVKTIGDAVYLRNHLLEMLERASVEKDDATRQAMLTVVVAGAGFAGVEVATQINGMFRDALRFYPTLKASEIRIIDVTNDTRILPQLSETLGLAGLAFMKKKGVEVRFGAEIVSATASAAIFKNGERIPTRTTVVTIGIGPNPVVTALPVEKDRTRIKCDEFCRVPGYEGVFAAGDNAHIIDPKTGKPVPATALASFFTGAAAGRNILRTIRGEPLQKFKFLNLGELTLMGPWFGLVEMFGIKFSGFFASLMGCMAYLSYVPTWRERINLIVDWWRAKIFPRDITQLNVSRTDAVLPMRFAAGETIVQEGDPGGRFYVVTEGEVEVVRRGADGSEIKIARLGPGQHFGEAALIQGTQRSATVRALGETKLLSMARNDFKALVSHLPALRESFESTARAREAQVAVRASA